MRTRAFKFSAPVAVALLVVFAGCTVTARPVTPVIVAEEGPPPAVVVNTAPPPPRVEIIPVAPSAEHIWIQGHWHWNGGAWIWRPGHYEMRRVGYRWVPAHYEARGPNWIYIGGHWAR